MTDLITPRLFQLVTPTPGQSFLSIQIKDGEQPMRLAVDRARLFQLNKDTADALLGHAEERSV